jgi:TDG/mug DNA glycosylase family protein
VDPVPDVVGPGLHVLFCGINPGGLSGQLGQHFARPGNRFWRVLHESGFTETILTPAQQGALPSLGLGITNLVPRVTAAASELSKDELRAGAEILQRKVTELRPRFVAVLGVGAYRTAFGRPRAAIGRQGDRIGSTGLWVLPNPSGLQARYQVPEMVTLFSELHRAAWP